MQDTTQRYWDVSEDLDNGNHEVSRWEADFIENLMESGKHTLSEKQKSVIARMAQQYLGEAL